MTSMAKKLQDKGRKGDTILAHINEQEVQILKDHGGAGTINPETGLMEFNFLTDLWDGFKSIVRQYAPVIIPAIAIFAPATIPAIGTWLGASSATAGVVGAAALSAGVTLAAGGSLKDVLTSAALAGASTYLTPMLGNALTPSGTGQLGQIMAGSAAFGAGYTALRGGSVKQMLAAASTGAASAYLGNLASQAVAKMNNMMASGKVGTIQQKGATDSIYAAGDAANLKSAGYTEAQIAQTLKSTGVDALTADYAAKSISNGMDASTLAANLAAGNTNGIYSGDASSKSITAGNNAESVQRIEDANFVAKDAAQLKAQGLSQDAIVENLVASGVDENVAKYVASYAEQGLDSTKLADKLVNSSNYMTSGKVYTGTETINRDLGQAMTSDQQKAFDALPFKEQVNNGTLTVDEASVLGKQGITTQQFNDLSKAGYTAGDISDLIGAGVDPSTLTNLSNSKFSEAQISSLLQNGVSANDISQASTALGSYKNLSVDEAFNLLDQGKTSSEITNLASTNKLPSQIQGPVAPVQTVEQQIASTGLVDNVDAKVLADAGYTASDVKTLINNGYQASDLADMASTGVKASTLSTLSNSPLSESAIENLLIGGTSANDIATVSTYINRGNLTVDQATNLLTRDVPIDYVITAAGNKTADYLIKGLDAGLSAQTVSQLQNSNVDINKLAQYINDGYIDPNQVTAKAASDTSWINKQINSTQQLIKTQEYATAGNVSPEDATVLAQHGYTTDDINKLVKLGYTAGDLADMASVGVSPSTLTTLANTQFSESTINDMLTSGKISANQIAQASQFVDAGKISAQTAETLLNKGINSLDFPTIANSGKADQFAQLMDNGVSKSNAQYLLDKKVDLARVNDLIGRGYLDSAQLEKNPANYSSIVSTATQAETTYNNQVAAQKLADEQAALKLQQAQEAQRLADQQAAAARTAQEAETARLAQEAAARQVEQARIEQTNQAISKIEPELVKTFANGTEEDPTAQHLARWAGVDVETAQKAMDAYKADPANYEKVYNTAITNQPKQVAEPTVPVQPEQTTQVAQAPVEPQGPTVQYTNNITGSDGTKYTAEGLSDGTTRYTNLTTGQVGIDFAPITPADWAQTHPTQVAQQPVVPENTVPVKLPDGSTGNYNLTTGEVTTENGQPVQTAQAQPQIPDTTVAGDVKVTVGGIPRYAGQEGAGTPPAGFQVAKPEDVFGPNDTGSANKPYTPGTYYDSETNTWYTPEVKAQEPFVPVPTAPVETPVSTTPAQPTVPVYIPPVETPVETPTPTQGAGGGGPIEPTTPTTVAPVENTSVQPSAPVAPQPTTPTVVSSSTRTTMDGSVYQDTQMSDGTTNTTLISGPSTGGTTGGGTTVQQPPLSPPTQVVIPDNSSYVAPVEVTTPVNPTETTTTTETPTDTTTPYIPIVTPEPPIVSKKPTTYGHYTLGPTPDLRIPQGLNPGFFTNVPKFYQNTTPTQSEFYWGQHPYQPTSTFNPTLYNTIPNAPSTPWGATYAQGPASAQQIIQAMGGIYPLLGTQGVTGPVAPQF